MDEFNFIYEENNFNSTEKIKGELKITKNQKRQTLLLERFKELDAILPQKIEENECIHLISSDNFGSIELAKCLTKRINPNYICFTTWSYNEDFIQFVESQLAKGVEIDFFVDKSIKTRKSHLYAQIVDLTFKYETFKIKIHHMLHAKVTIMGSFDSHVIIEASANYSKNQRIENFTITNDLELFNFHKNWMHKLIGD